MKFRFFSILIAVIVLIGILFMGLRLSENSTDFARTKSEIKDKEAMYDSEINLEDYTPKKPKIITLTLLSEHTNEGTPVHIPPPFIPPRAEKSGHCVYELQVNVLGKVESIISLNCSDDIFVTSTKTHLLKWRFYPKKDENNQNQPFKYGPNKITYRLVGLDGKIIPE